MYIYIYIFITWRWWLIIIRTRTSKLCYQQCTNATIINSKTKIYIPPEEGQHHLVVVVAVAEMNLNLALYHITYCYGTAPTPPPLPSPPLKKKKKKKMVDTSWRNTIRVWTCAHFNSFGMRFLRRVVFRYKFLLSSFWCCEIFLHLRWTSLSALVDYCKI